MSSADAAGPLWRCSADLWYSSRTWYWVCWVLVHKVGLGSKGAALASAVSYSTNLAILCLYTRLSGACRMTWTWFSMEAFAFKELRQFAELAVPSAMMVCLEWWSFELLVLLSGLLPNPKLETSVLSICLNTGALMFTVPSGLCAAISTCVSNELGAGRPQVARMATIVVICMALFAGSVISITMILLRKSWDYMYNNEEEVVTYIARMIPVLGVSFFIDGIHTSLSGNLCPNLMFELFAMYREWQEEMAKEISGRQFCGSSVCRYLIASLASSCTKHAEASLMAEIHDVSIKALTPAQAQAKPQPSPPAVTADKA
ncbi:Protein TRANSPARENT TESTA 12 [Hordeum vulgare]|nr:Protein TRANSPARENT TESTA 12 [Hordeum vulgare]